MKRFLSFLLVSLLSISIFSMSVFAASDDVVSVDPEQYDSVLDSLQKRAVSQVVPASGNVTGSESDLLVQSADSFVPTLEIQGSSYPYNANWQAWLDFVSYGQAVFAPAMQNDTANYSLAQVNNATYQVQLSGFQPDSTYNGVAYFQLQTLRASKAGSNSYIYVAAQSGSHGTPQGFSLLTDFLVTSLSCKDGSGQDVPVYYSRVLSSDGTTYMYTFYILLQDFYIPPSNGVVSTNRVVCDITFSMASSVNYTVPSTNTFPVSYYSVVNNTLRFFSRSFSGTVESGKHTFDGDNRQDIANSQASLSESQHDDLINGFDDSAGNAANKSLEDGLSSYESEEQKAHDDFNKAMDDYTNPDLSSYKSGFAFLSSAAMSWWNALGMFKVILLVGFGLMIFNFISRYRGG